MSRSILGLRLFSRLLPSRTTLPTTSALQRRHKTIDPSKIGPGLIQPENRIHVTFHCDGEVYKTYGKAGDSLLDVVVDRDIPLDGFGFLSSLSHGAESERRGTLACSTCHVVLSQEDYDRIPESPMDEEMDMLDLAYGIEDTSRLGCQIVLEKKLDGLEMTVPAGRTDARLND